MTILNTTITYITAAIADDDQPDAQRFAIGLLADMAHNCDTTDDTKNTHYSNALGNHMSMFMEKLIEVLVSEDAQFETKMITLNSIAEVVSATMTNFDAYREKVMQCIQNAAEMSLQPVDQNMQQTEYEDQMQKMHTLRTTLLNCFIALASGFDSVYFNLTANKRRSMLTHIEFFYKYLDRLVMTENVQFDEETTTLIYELYLDIRAYFKEEINHLVKGSTLADNLGNNVTMLEGGQYDEIKTRMQGIN